MRSNSKLLYITPVRVWLLLEQPIDEQPVDIRAVFTNQNFLCQAQTSGRGQRGERHSERLAMKPAEVRFGRRGRSSPFLGVFRDQTHWRSRVYVEGKAVYTKGKFLTVEEAARAHDRLAVQILGRYILTHSFIRWGCGRVPGYWGVFVYLCLFPWG